MNVNKASKCEFNINKIVFVNETLRGAHEHPKANDVSDSGATAAVGAN